MSIYLFDITETLIGMVDPRDVIESEQDYTLNSLITASFRARYDPIIDDALFFGHRDVDEPQNFWLYRITDSQKSGNVIDVSGTYSFFDDLQGGIVRDLRPENKKAGVVLRQILEDNRWLVGIDKSTAVRSASFYYTSKLDAFWQMLDRWGVEFKPRITYSNGTITGRYIDLADRFAENAGKWYEHGDKLLTVKASVNSGSIHTAFLGRGKGEETAGGGYGRKITFADVEWRVEDGDPVDKPAGQDYVEIPGATERFGYHGRSPRVQIVEFSDVTDREELLELTYLYGLNHCRPLVQYEAIVAENEYAKPGEIVSIIRPDLGIRYKTRIFRIKRDLLVQGKKTIEFGEQLVRSQGQRAVEQQRKQKEQEREIIAAYEATRQEIVDSYFNEDAYTYRLESGNKYELPAGTYSFDKPIDKNPTKVIYFGAGKILIANSKNADGSWNWSTVGTGDGFVAENMFAGTFIGEVAELGYVEAESVRVSDGNNVEAVIEDGFTEFRQGLSSMSSELNSAITQTADNITSQVESTYVKESDFGTQFQQQFSTTIEQTDQAIEFATEQIRTELGATISELQTENDRLREYVRVSGSTIELGKNTSPLKAVIRNDRMFFEMNGKEVGYFAYNKFYITDGEILGSLKIGEFQFFPQENGHLSLRKVGK